MGVSGKQRKGGTPASRDLLWALLSSKMPCEQGLQKFRAGQGWAAECGATFASLMSGFPRLSLWVIVM